jgi:hypothetical protein
MSGMPFVFEQGAMLSVIDDYLSNPVRAADTLARLRPAPFGKGERVATAGGLSAVNSATFGFDPIKHLNRHWFGRDEQGNKVATWWVNWSGEAEEIMRWTLITAIERSLGVPHLPPGSPGPAPTITPTRSWPIHLYWSCGAPFFQGWTSWHEHGGGPRDGVVNAVFCTPGNTEALYATPHPKGAGIPGSEDPAHTVGKHGLWVIGQGSTKRDYAGNNDPDLGVGKGVLPENYGLKLRSEGAIVIVAPSERTGGVLPGGRRYDGSTP